MRPPLVSQVGRFHGPRTNTKKHNVMVYMSILSKYVFQYNGLMDFAPKNTPKHIHIVGICGVGTSALAIALHTGGYKVTGSDKGFFPPVSEELKSAGVKYHAGWHPENFEKIGIPDTIVAGGGGTSSINPELIYAKEKNIPIITFAEAVGKYITKEHSIVCVGTWGKSTSTALLTHIFTYAKKDPTYFIGALPVGMPSGKLTDSNTSIVEGDEYKAAIFEERAKFFFYNPTHIILSSISWDHADLYPTPGDYLNAFVKLTEMPDIKTIVACSDNANVNAVVKNSGKNVLTYGTSRSAQAYYENVVMTPAGIHFDIHFSGKVYKIQSDLLGTYNAENITGCFLMASEFGIEPEKIVEAVATFKGMKRRMEKRLDGDINIVDDIAHSPAKARVVLETLRKITTGKILAVFEPNIGAREKVVLADYDNAFVDADTVIIPKLSNLKTEEGKEVTAVNGDGLAEAVSRTHANTKYIEDDATLTKYILDNAKKGDAIVFLGSHGFRGMIEEVINKLTFLHQQSQ